MSKFIIYFSVFMITVTLAGISYMNYIEESVPDEFYCLKETKFQNLSLCEIMKFELEGVREEFYEQLETECTTEMVYDCSGYEHYAFIEKEIQAFLWNGTLKTYLGCDNCTKEYMNGFTYYDEEYRNPFTLLPKSNIIKSWKGWIDEGLLKR